MRRYVAVIAIIFGLELATATDVSALPGQVAQVSVMAAGEIKAVNRDAGQLTIDHGPLLNLSVPPSVRVFSVRDRGLLDQVKVGDSVLFLAENVAGVLTVVRIETGPGDPHGDH